MQNKLVALADNCTIWIPCKPSTGSRLRHSCLSCHDRLVVTTYDCRTDGIQSRLIHRAAECCRDGLHCMHCQGETTLYSIAAVRWTAYCVDHRRRTSCLQIHWDHTAHYCRVHLIQKFRIRLDLDSQRIHQFHWISGSGSGAPLYCTDAIYSIPYCI